MCVFVVYFLCFTYSLLVREDVAVAVQFTYPYIMIVQPPRSGVKSVMDLCCCWLLSC